MEAPKRPVQPEAGNPVPLRQVFLLAGSSYPSEPIYGLANELRSLGITVYPADPARDVNPFNWVYFAMRSQALVFTRYKNGDGQYLKRQIYRAKLLGCAVVRWWVGTDVLMCLESQYSMQIAREVDEAVDLNIAVSPHLVTELRELGIEAEYVPSFCDFSALQIDPPSTLPKGVLTYLPTKRKAFYGEKILVAAIEANPDLVFFIIADESHSLSRYPNVNSLGWVDDLQDIWAQVGLLLRVTEHDGMPRMVLDALAMSRYVIYSEYFEGCWFARSTEQVLEHLETFKSLDKPNVSGPPVVKVSKDANALYADKIETHLRTDFSFKRFGRLMNTYVQLK